MRIKHLTETDFVVSRWSGGFTTQLWIAPEGAVYGDRDFLWRVSSASVELDFSDFTPLADYHRWITTLDGSITLTHDGGAPIRLSPYDIHDFDGAAATSCLGRCRDFNLMLRKGQCRGAVRCLRLSGEAVVGPELGPDPLFPHCTLLIYCGSGCGVLTLPEGSLRCAEGECILVEDAPSARLPLAAYGPSHFLIAEILQHEFCKTTPIFTGPL